MNRRGFIWFGLLAGQPLWSQTSAESLFQQGLKAPTPEAAIELFKQSIAAAPSFEAYYRLGSKYVEVKRYPEALDALRQAFLRTVPAQKSERAHVLFRQAQAREGTGSLRRAHELLQASLELEDHPVVRQEKMRVEDVLAREVAPDPKSLHEDMQASKDFDVQATGPPKVPVWVNFDTGKATLGEIGLKQAMVLVNELCSPSHTDYRFVLVGHADRTGSDKINDPLSVERARTIQKFLLERKLPPERIAVEGRGSHEPLRTGDSADDYRVNRRVEVTLLRIP